MIIDNYLGSVNYQRKFDALYYEKNINGENIYFIKPQTYMNLSGKCVKKFVEYYKIDYDDILVIQDDMDIELGKFKVKYNSSSGGHNGIKSIINELNCQKFSRLKIGIKTPRVSNDIDFVLGHFTKEEICKITDKNALYNEIINSFIFYGIDKTMCLYNNK